MDEAQLSALIVKVFQKASSGLADESVNGANLLASMDGEVAHLTDLEMDEFALAFSSFCFLVAQESILITDERGTKEKKPFGIQRRSRRSNPGRVVGADVIDQLSRRSGLSDDEVRETVTLIRSGDRRMIQRGVPALSVAIMVANELNVGRAASDRVEKKLAGIRPTDYM